MSMWVAWAGMVVFVGMYGWIWKRAGDKGREWMEWGLVALVGGLSALSVALHEPWRDELHAWILARELTWGQLWNEMACEGHFLPWFLLLRALARSGAPVWTMGAVAWVLNAIAVWWMVKKSPLTGGEKAAAGLSCVFLYVNPAIARPYVLVPLALFGVASLWQSRDERPVTFGLWIAFLANTHVCLEGVAVAVFGVFAWQNLLHRGDGKSWKECGRQWTGLGVMVAGGTLALVQILPSLWKSSLVLGHVVALREYTACFFQACVPRWGAVFTLSGLALIGVEAWKKDRGAFCVHMAGLAYMWGLSVFFYEALILNRALQWWPVVIFTAWILAEKERVDRRWRVLAVVVAGLSITRPDLTWEDWLKEYDPLPGACRWIAERYGRDTEVWINGGDSATEPVEAYLVNVMDWRTGGKAVPVSWARTKGTVPLFRNCSTAVFQAHPEKESFLALGGMWPLQFSGLEGDDCKRPGVAVERIWSHALGAQAVWLILLRVTRWGGEWIPLGVVRYQRGDHEGAVSAWEQAVEEDGTQWEAMNNLAWVLLEEGRVGEARVWIDRAMEHDMARKTPGVWDTEFAIRRAEEGANMNKNGEKAER